MHRHYRLKKSFQYRYIYRNGKSYFGKEMTLLVVKNQNARMKIGYSVTKKIGKAHIRNRVRRLFKEASRLMLPHIDKNSNYIIVAKPPCVESSYQEIYATLEKLMKKAGRYVSENNSNIHNKSI